MEVVFFIPPRLKGDHPNLCYFQAFYFPPQAEKVVDLASLRSALISALLTTRDGDPLLFPPQVLKADPPPPPPLGLRLSLFTSSSTSPELLFLRTLWPGNSFSRLCNLLRLKARLPAQELKGARFPAQLLNDALLPAQLLKDARFSPDHLFKIKLFL